MSAQPSGARPAPTALSADDPREIGGYRLHARLGAGGMGVVYLAHTPGGRPIALKVVREDFAGDPEFRRRFAREVASARRIHGLFTAQVVDSGVDAPTPWLATAYVPGPSLHQAVQRHGPLPVRTVLLLAAGIAEALDAIHRAGVVHRDLKPANVLLAEDGPRVIDFGIARAADAGVLTGTGLRIGTAAFMAPEQALGRPVSPATDVFALGALLAYVSSGEAPFGTGPESAALYRVVHERPDLARVPHDLRDLVARCLAKRPEDRPGTADLIAAVHAHPLVGPRPEFTDGWLPRSIGGEVAGRTETAERPGPGREPGPESGFESGLGLESGLVSLPVYAQATLTAPEPPSPPAGPGTPAVPSPRRAARRRGGRRPALMLLAAFAVLAALGGAVQLLAPFREAVGSGGGPVPASSYVLGDEVELTSPDATYEFDLEAGKVVPADTAAWYLARDASEFVLPEDGDAFVPTGYELDPADCVRGIETGPVTRVAYADLADERPFCVRSPDGLDLVVVRLVEARPDGPVTASFARYHRK
ncbi:serine/threonine-protein kinase [Streptomyces sp. S1]|uniref:serine/threonine-protein kinase n=1 Tax=Streptomyces sp. S1 TaxID=718288 RepID=UPI000EF7CC51|nr:serine/threonine-protein kinase [Streptomyces sp. S1]